MKPNVIDWRISSNCNQKCEYCYATDYASHMAISTGNDDEIINKIVEIGCSSVCISGGEPLLDDNGERAYKIIESLKSKGLNIFLSTNGTNYLNLEKKYCIGELLSKLSLPLDGFDLQSSGINGRGETFNYVKAILDTYNEDFHKGKRIPNIKVSTVITKKNINERDYWKQLVDFIKSYPIIKLWKIYDFVPENRGANNKNTLLYTSKEFDDFLKYIVKFKKDLRCSLEIVNRTSRSGVYFIIRPDGSVVIPQDCGDITQEIYIGNIISDSVEILLAKWSAQINTAMCQIYSYGRMITNLGGIINDAIMETILTKISGDTLFSEDLIFKKVETEISIPTTVTEIESKFQSLKRGINPVIREIVPIINLPELGLQVYLVNLTFNGNAGYTSEQIANIICANGSVGWCAHYKIIETDGADILNKTSSSRIVFRIALFASTMQKCTIELNSIIDTIRSAFVSKSIDYVPEKYVAYDRILESETDGGLDGRLIRYSDPHRSLKFSKQEKEVLIAMSSFRDSNNLSFENLLNKMIAEFHWRKGNARKLLLTIIDSLRRKQIINMFQLVTNDTQLGYNTFLIIYDLHPMHDEPEEKLKADFEDYVKDLPGVTHVNLLNNGDWDADIEIKVKTRGELSHIVSCIDDRYGNEIRNRQYMELIKEYRFTFLIPTVVNAIKNS